MGIEDAILRTTTADKPGTSGLRCLIKFPWCSFCNDESNHEPQISSPMTIAFYTEEIGRAHSLDACVVSPSILGGRSVTDRYILSKAIATSAPISELRGIV